MTSLMILLLLLAFVFLALIFPVKPRQVNFDEKGEAIKVYQDEVAHLERQLAKGFIDAEEQSQLLAELDRKSALAITAIEKRSYTYRRSLVPLVLSVLGLAAASVLYFQHYQNNGVYRWQAFHFNNRDAITEGLFDAHVVEQFIQQNDANTAAAYCFAMQETLLEKYDTNPETLANLALCHLQVGYPTLAVEAGERGLKTQPDHAELNYVMAEADFLENKALSPQSLDRLLKTIKQNPTHFKALRLLAINSLRQGDYRQARFFFAELKKLSGNNPQLLAALERMDKEISEKISKEQSANVDETTAKTTATTTTKTQTPTTAKTTTAPTLSLSIAFSPTIAEQLNGSQTVFVVVKSAEGQLLNATKHVVSDLSQPLSVSVSDSQAGAMQMQPMAGHQSVNVVARISKNGSPIATAGDLTSATQTVDLSSDKVVNLLIDTVVE